MHMRDAEALARGGIDAVIFENFGDVPFLTGPVPPEAVAAMAVVIERVAKNVDVPFGVNVLRNDPIAALGLAYGHGGRVHPGERAHGRDGHRPRHHRRWALRRR